MSQGGTAPTVITLITLILFIVIVSGIAITIIYFHMVVGNFETQKQKKTFASAIVYDNQLLSLRGEAQRNPCKDRIEGWSDIIHFCNKISLTIKNEGSLPIDTDVCKQPIAFNLDVRGKLEDVKDVPGGVELLDVKPANPKLDLNTKDGQVLLNHVHLNPSESLQLVFLGYFTVVNIDEP